MPVFEDAGDGKVKSFMDIYTPLKKGELLEGTEDTRFQRAWERARADSFAAHAAG